MDHLSPKSINVQYLQSKIPLTEYNYQYAVVCRRFLCLHNNKNDLCMSTVEKANKKISTPKWLRHILEKKTSDNKFTTHSINRRNQIIIGHMKKPWVANHKYHGITLDQKLTRADT